ncbi:MAG: DUF58 domain-containing protein [Thiohalophilus sp.]|uniref:DUF58 domain-containing protein n=1 Tax=Thiohalophilus sp. TaxID=3028392 RepID=UPI0028706274|nr:DUF58 domain-containing protein [Thiohalophilus sp.]MDR9435310.1 DUF58 domain-containing protein [Thiohalophilus sp.]
MSLARRAQRLSFVQRFNLARFFKGDAPSAAPWVLNRRNVYILPTRQGLFFAVTLMIILLGAINYNNSLGYFLTFLLGSIAIVGILHTYRNLLRLEVRLASIEPVFAGGEVTVPVVLHNPGTQRREQIALAFAGQEPKSCAIPPSSQHVMSLHRPAGERGWQPVGRFTLASTFPLGLFRAWSHVVPDSYYLVYPRPAAESRLPQTSRYMASLIGDQGIGSDDFAGLRGYRTGDSLKHVHWKALAREQGLLTKQFGGDRSERLWFDWRMLEGRETEARLSQLCRWVIEAEQQGLEYGLWLPDQIIEPGRGHAHQQQCLQALALFGV